MKLNTFVEVLNQHRMQLVKMGVAGRLLIAGELRSVVPLENAAALPQANPVHDGELKPDAMKPASRSDAQVRELLKAGPVTVIELGGSHDLSAAVKPVADGKCEYLRVTTRRAKQLLDCVFRVRTVLVTRHDRGRPVANLGSMTSHFFTPNAHM